MPRMTKKPGEVIVTDEEGDRLSIRKGMGDNDFYIGVIPKGCHPGDGAYANVSRKWLFYMIDHIDSERSV